MVFCQKSITYGPVFSSSLFRGIYFIESLRSKILPNIKKKSRRKFLKMTEVRDELRKIFRLFSKIENFRKFSKKSKFFEIMIFRFSKEFRLKSKNHVFENVRKFEIFSKKIKTHNNFRGPTSSCHNFF